MLIIGLALWNSAHICNYIELRRHGMGQDIDQSENDMIIFIFKVHFLPNLRGNSHIFCLNNYINLRWHRPFHIHDETKEKGATTPSRFQTKC